MALIMPAPELVNSFAQWQADNLIHNCLNCQTKFSFLVRKHHCRCCGGIFCANCSDNFLWYDKRKVKVVRRKDDTDGFEVPPYRTCNSCCENLTQMHLIQPRWGDKLMRLQGSSMRTPQPQPAPVLPTSSSASSVQATELAKASGAAENTRDLDQESNRCPICNLDLIKLSEIDSAMHIQNCIERAELTQQHHDQSSPGESPAQRNRMLVYVIPPDQDTPDPTSQGDPECPICFEEMKPGDKVGRLECLCVFHYDCIKSWFRKKSQKLKSTTGKSVSKNFCPLHDAVF